MASIIWRPLAAAGAYLTAAAWTTTATAAAAAPLLSIVDHSLEVRRSNIVRVSEESCSECVPMEEFFAANRLVFLLFYDPPQRGIQNYKQAIIEGFHETCKRLQFSYITCGKVDTMIDKSYAERYIQPKTAPAHILVREGQALWMPKEHGQKLLKRPGDVDAMLWHLREMLGPELTRNGTAAEQFDIAQVVHGRKPVDSLLKKHVVVIVGFTGDAKDASKLVEAFRASAQSLVLNKKVDSSLGLTDGSKKAKERARVAFVAARGAGIAEAMGQKPGTIVAFVDGNPVNVEAQHALTADVAATVPGLLQVSLGGLKAAFDAGYKQADETADAAVAEAAAAADSKSGKGKKAKKPVLVDEL